MLASFNDRASDGTGRVRVHVVDGDRSMANIPVIAGVERGGFVQLGRQRTNADGVVWFRGLPENTILLHVERRPPFAHSATAVWLDEGEEEHVQLRLERGGRVHGRVVNEFRAPLSGVEVELSTGVHPVVTGSDGRFSFSAVAPTPSGVWIVEGRPVPSALHDPEVYASHEGREASMPCGVLEGETLDLGDLVIEGLSEPALLIGHVLDSSGNPVIHAAVGPETAFAQRRGLRFARGFIFSAKVDESLVAWTDSTGRFELEVPSNEPHELAVWTDEEVYEEFDARGAAPGETVDGLRFVLSPHVRFSLAIHATRSFRDGWDELSVRVRDDEGTWHSTELGDFDDGVVPVVSLLAGAAARAILVETGWTFPCQIDLPGGLRQGDLVDCTPERRTRFEYPFHICSADTTFSAAEHWLIVPVLTRDPNPVFVEEFWGHASVSDLPIDIPFVRADDAPRWLQLWIKPTQHHDPVQPIYLETFGPFEPATPEEGATSRPPSSGAPRHTIQCPALSDLDLPALPPPPDAERTTPPSPLGIVEAQVIDGATGEALTDVVAYQGAFKSFKARRLPKLSPGRWRVESGLIQITFTAPEHDVSATRSVQVSPDAAVDLGQVTLDPWPTVTGVLVTQHDQPAAQARLRFRTAPSTMSFDAATNDAGQFSLTLPPHSRWDSTLWNDTFFYSDTPVDRHASSLRLVLPPLTQVRLVLQGDRTDSWLGLTSIQSKDQRPISLDESVRLPDGSLAVNLMLPPGRYHLQPPTAAHQVTEGATFELDGSESTSQHRVRIVSRL